MIAFSLKIYANVKWPLFALVRCEAPSWPIFLYIKLITLFDFSIMKITNSFSQTGSKNSILAFIMTELIQNW